MKKKSIFLPQLPAKQVGNCADSLEMEVTGEYFCLHSPLIAQEGAQSKYSSWPARPPQGTLATLDSAPAPQRAPRALHSGPPQPPLLEALAN